MNRTDMIASLDEFYELYSKRPIQDNTGGMKSPHMFATWWLLKQLNPEFVIESGVFRGAGTWLMNVTLPDALVISIDPNPRQMIYENPNGLYLTTDFLNNEWTPTGNDLVFFDDHMPILPRLKRCKELGFKHTICDDNYNVAQGDCISPKKIISGESYVIDTRGVRSWYEPNKEDNQWFKENVEGYFEFPPIFADTVSRWGTLWEDEYDTVPLLDESFKDKYPVFWSERRDYTSLCYIQLC